MLRGRNRHSFCLKWFALWFYLLLDPCPSSRGENFETFHVTENMGISLPCRNATSGLTIVDWYRSTLCDSEEARTSLTGIEGYSISPEFVLTIEKSSFPRDEGCYTCEDLTTNRSLHRTRMTFLVPPENIYITKEPGQEPISSTDSNLGQELTLLCNVPRAQPQPMFKWTVGDQEFDQTSMSMVKNHSFWSRLKFTPRLDMQRKNLTCLAWNSGQRAASAYIQLTFANSSSGSVEIQNTTKHLGVSVLELSSDEDNRVNCEARRFYPEPRFDWTKGDENIHDESTTESDFTFVSQVIINPATTDIGKVIKCSASSPATGVEAKAEIRVLAPPVFTPTQKRTVRAELESTAEIFVYFYSYPHVSIVTWEKDGKVIPRELHKEESEQLRLREGTSDEDYLVVEGSRSTLTIAGVVLSDIGTYLVTVENSLGNATFVVQLEEAEIQEQNVINNNEPFIALAIAIIVFFLVFIIFSVVKKARSMINRNVAFDPALFMRFRRPRMETPRVSAFGVYEDLSPLPFPFTEDNFDNASNIVVEEYVCPVVPKKNCPSSDTEEAVEDNPKESTSRGYHDEAVKDVEVISQEKHGAAGAATNLYTDTPVVGEVSQCMSHQEAVEDNTNEPTSQGSHAEAVEDVEVISQEKHGDDELYVSLRDDP